MASTLGAVHLFFRRTAEDDMSEISKVNVQLATTDPESAFKHPDELVECVGLTRGQKLAALEKWAFSVRSRVDAVSEGMLNHSGGAYTHDVEMLREIEKRIEFLRHPQAEQ
jgi:hypothetical protein